MPKALQAAFALSIALWGALPVNAAFASESPSNLRQSASAVIHLQDEDEDEAPESVDPAGQEDSEFDEEERPESEDFEDAEQEHDITAPTTVIKPGEVLSKTNLPPSQTGAKPSDVSRRNAPDSNISTFVDPTDDRDSDGVGAFSLTENEAVVEKLPTADFQDPATEFMAKAYFAVGTLGVGAVALAGNALIRARRLRSDGKYDYDYEA